MSQQLLRPLRQWPWLHFHHHHPSCCTKLALHRHHHHHLLLLTSLPQESTKTRRFSLAPHASPRGGLRRPNVPPPTNTDLVGEEEPKSRNQLKREAKRAIKWGMDLASFSPPQIKLIIRVASLEQVVFEALMLVKRMGPDVREGRRRQFSYIGKLLREVEPELMDRLIRATKDADQRELQALSGLVSDNPEDDDNLIEIEYEEEEEEEEEKESKGGDSQVTRWFDGLINKDIQITSEVYSVQGVEFDRQELRKLVREVHFAQEMKAANEEDQNKIEKALIRAKKALTRFLRRLLERISDEY